jgi:hypothetical protein
MDDINEKNKEIENGFSVIEDGELETGVFYKGKGRISNGAFTVINLPKNVDKNCSDLIIQINPIYANKKFDADAIYLDPVNNPDPDVHPLYPSQVRNNSFVVYGPNSDFIWIVTGKYKNIDNVISNSIPKKNISTFRCGLEDD